MIVDRRLILEQRQGYFDKLKIDAMHRANLNTANSTRHRQIQQKEALHTQKIKKFLHLRPTSQNSNFDINSPTAQENVND